MTIDTGMASVLVTILLSMLALAVAWGTIHERVRNIRSDIEKDRKDNRDDHKQILSRIDDVKRSLNGKA